MNYCIQVCQIKISYNFQITTCSFWHLITLNILMIILETSTVKNKVCIARKSVLTYTICIPNGVS